MAHSEVSALLDVCEAELVTIMDAARQRRRDDVDKNEKGPFEFYEQFCEIYGPLIQRRWARRAPGKGNNVKGLPSIGMPRYRPILNIFSAPLRGNVLRPAQGISDVPPPLAFSVPPALEGNSDSRVPSRSRKRVRESSLTEGEHGTFSFSRRRLLSNYWTTETLLKAGTMCAADLQLELIQ